MLNNLKKKKKGFTLIELIIVIAIIAIIAAIAVPKLLQSKTDANDKADISNAKTIANAYMNAVADSKIDPTKLSGDIIAVTKGEILISTSTNDTIKETIKKLQSVPTTNTPTKGNYYIVAGIDGAISIYSANDDKTAIGTKLLFPQA